MAPTPLSVALQKLALITSYFPLGRKVNPGPFVPFLTSLSVLLALTCVVTVFDGEVVAQRTVRCLAVQIVFIPAHIAGHHGLALSPLPGWVSPVSDGGAPFSPAVHQSTVLY